MRSLLRDVPTVSIIALILSACGGSGGSDVAQSPPPPPPPPPPVNSVPVAFDLGVKTNVDEALNSTMNAQDTDGDSLTFSVTELPMKGNVEIIDANSGTFRYTPDPAEFGSDLFRYRVADATSNSNEAVVTITINRIPMVQAVSLRAATTQPRNGALVASDDDGDLLDYEILAPPVNGTIESFDNSTGDFTYRANVSYEGDDSFTFRVNDGFAESAVETVSLTVDEWIGTVNLGTVDDEQIVYGLEVDDQRNLFVAHSTSGAIPGGQSQGGLDVVLTKLDRSGSIVWQKQWGTAGDEIPYQIVRDSSGNLYVMVYPDLSAQVPSTAVYVLKYDLDGNLVWSLELPDTLNISRLYRITLSPDQTVYITAHDEFQDVKSLLLKITPSGVLDWVKFLGTDEDDPSDPLHTGQFYSYIAFVRDLAVDSGNTIYVTLNLWYEVAGTNVFTSSSMLVTLDGNGTILSRIEPFTTSAFPAGAGPVSPRDLRLLPNGNLRVSGDVLGDIVVAEVDTSGNEIWSTIHPVAGERRYGFRGTVTADGSSVVTGLRVLDDAPIQDDDVAIHKFDSTGTFVWDQVLSSTLPDGTAVRDSGGQPVADSDGNIYMAVTSEGGAIEPETNQGGSDVFIVKLDGLSGQIIESR